MADIKLYIKTMKVMISCQKNNEKNNNNNCFISKKHFMDLNHYLPLKIMCRP